MGVPTPRTPVGLGRSVEERLLILESRSPSLPDRLSTFGAEVATWDDALTVGFYWSPDGYVGQVMVSPTGIVQQRQLVVPAQGRMEIRSFNGLVWSPWRREDGMYRGTALERGGITPAYWDFWQDTDGTQKLYVGSKSGTWRRFSGEVTLAAKAWDVSAAPFYGRTDSSTLPTILESTETLNLVPTSGGSSYAAFLMNGVTRNPTDSVVVTRLTAFNNATIQGYSFAWAIHQN